MSKTTAWQFWNSIALEWQVVPSTDGTARKSSERAARVMLVGLRVRLVEEVEL